MPSKGRNRTEEDERANKAIALRIRGKSWPAIADALDYASASSACQAVRRRQKQVTHEGIRELRALEVDRLDVLMEAHWDDAVAVEDEGNPRYDADGKPLEFDWRRKQGAAQTIVRIMERRSKFLGADMPAQVENLGSMPITVVLDSGVTTKGAEAELPTIDVDE